MTNDYKSNQNRFLSEFHKFSNQIRAFFNDVAAKGRESKITEVQKVTSEEKIEWVEAGADGIPLSKVREISDTVKEDRDDDKVLLMKKLTKKLNEENGKYYASFWYAEKSVEKSYVTLNKIYDKGISTYVWNPKDAASLMMNGSVALNGTGKNGVYELTFHHFLKMDNSMNGWNHFHIFQSGRKANGPLKKAHSFFGPMFLRSLLNPYEYEVYPKNNC